MTQAPLVFVGVATHDAIAQVGRFPKPDERVVVDDVVTAGGGAAATAAVAAARRGATAAFVGPVGTDAAGDDIIAELAAEGINVDHCPRIEGAASAASVVIVDTKHSTRAILNRPLPPLLFEQLPTTTREFLATARWIHVDQSGWTAISNWWRLTGERPRLSIDARDPLESFSAAGVDLYVPTLHGLRRQFGDLATETVIEAALQEGARWVVATNGPAGAYIGQPGRPTVHVPAVDGPVLSTVGVGDVFHGALLAAVARGDELASAVGEAAEVAYASCQAIDARSAIPRLAAA